ncbi:MAG: hypothetical protein E6767_20190 [Dysgonomonas sp.]|nr:hypothetical protein [Dysgonomonas sp.]
MNIAKIIFALVSLLITSSFRATAQNHTSNKLKYFTPYIGYSINPREEEKKEGRLKTYHMPSIGVVYSWPKVTQKEDINRSSLTGYNLYVENEFVLNTPKFGIGPKMGMNYSLSFFNIGTEFICYTNFDQSSVYFRPYLGLAVGPLRTSVGYNVALSDKKKLRINPVSISLAVPLFMPK